MHLPTFIPHVSGENIEPIFANIFEIHLENSNADPLDELFFSFYAYEKIVFGKEPFIKLHFSLCENRNIIEKVSDVKKISIEGHNKKGHLYLKQIFMVEYVDYMISQNYNDDGILSISFQYKILDQEVIFHDV